MSKDDVNLFMKKGSSIPCYESGKTRAPIRSDVSANVTHEGTPLSDFEILCKPETYIQAFKHCKKGTYWKYSVQAFRRDLLRNCSKLAQEIKEGTYRPSNTYNFTIFERGKQRYIQAPAIRDRVLIHALCHDILENKIYPKMIYDNSATIKNRGMSFARKRILTHLRKFHHKHGNNGYILQLDFRKFFDSIDHELLIEEFKKYVKDPQIMQLIETCVRYNKSSKGLGIGSELSQIAGVMFPHSIDFYCKVKQGIKYYGRYMDDVYIIHQDKEYLKRLYHEIVKVADTLKLSFNPKKVKITKLSNTFIFLKGKYRLSQSGKVSYLPCASTIRRTRRRLNRIIKNLSINPENLEYIYDNWRGNVLRQFPKSKNIIKRFDDKYSHTRVSKEKSK